MQTLESLKRRIDSAEDLQTVARTMKTLAAVSIRQYETAVDALAHYHQTLELGLRMLLWQTPRAAFPVEAEGEGEKAPGTVGAIVFGSDQGMCGQFNDQLATYAMHTLAELAADPAHRSVLVVGRRAAAHLIDAGQPLEAEWDVPGSLAAITPLIQDLLTTIDCWRTLRRRGRILLLYNRRVSAASYKPHRYQLLPIDPRYLAELQTRTWPSSSLPMFTMRADRLVSAVVRQLLFASLFRACAESLAAENASRIASMQAAERNIADQLDELRTQFHQQRQTAITEELLDVVTGFEALSDTRP